MTETNISTARVPQVTVIDPRIPEKAKLRVAAYARVSSDSEDQVNSYIAQVDFYSKHIAGKEDWEMVVKAGIAAVLAGEEQTLSLPAVEHQIRNLQERQLELFQLIVSAGADCTDYDEELQQVYMAKTKLMAQKAELEKEHRGAAAFDSRLAELDMALEQASGALTDFDELTVRQLVSNIKVLDKDSLLICFKDGTEITQTIQRRRSA